MRDNMTLGEMKKHCAELNARYGEKCCDNCEFAELGCCDPPDNWKLEAGICKAQPNWEAMFKQSEDACRHMHMKLEEAHKEIDFLAEENERQRIMINTIETMIGRKFDV